MENNSEISDRPYSVIRATLIWVGLTAVLFVVIGVLRGRNVPNSIGYAFGAAVIASIPFLLFDRFENKTAARLLYLICLAGIIYFWYFA